MQPNPPPQPSYDQQVMRALRRIIHGVDVYSRRLRSAHDITTAQLMTLQLLASGPQRLTYLAREMHLTPSTVVGVLDRLEAKGLITRARGTTADRRVVQIALSPRGEAFIAKAPSALQSTLSDALKKLPDTQQAVIAQSLEKIVTMMEAQPETGLPPLLDSEMIE